MDSYRVPPVSTGKLKVVCRFIAPALLLALIITLHGRVTAPVNASTPEIESFQKSALGELTSGDPQIDKMIVETGSRYGVDPKLVYYVIRQESQFKPNARSGKDAQGLMQIISATAERFKINRYDPEQNIKGGVLYLRWLLQRFDGDVTLALAGYNAGEGSVAKCGNRVPDYKETRNYVQKITSAYGKSYHPVREAEPAVAEAGD